ncbi:MAG: MFS transporter [Micromonosporaceae bacterium]|nr:MFS transporter [Micromonosporaceae bacterium]
MAGSSLAPLRYAPFRLLVAGRTVTMLGNAVAPIALAFAVLDLTGSVRDLGLVVGARSLANVLFLLAGGVIADRFPRHLVMVAASGSAAVTQAVVATAVLTGTATIPLLAGLAAVNGMVSAFAFPASSALLPQTVPAQIRQQANAISRLGFNAGTIAGAAAGGVLVALVGPGWGLAVDAATFAIAAACFGLVQVPDVRDRTAGRQHVLADLREGWTAFAGRTWLWVVVVGFLFFNAAYAAVLGVLGPAVADQTIGRGAWGLVLAAQTTGMVVGAVVALRLRVRRLLLFGVVGIGTATLLPVALALAPQVAVLLAAAFLGGLGIEQFGVAWETSMQEHIPADRLARVYSYDALGSFVAIPAGQVSAGPTALAIGTDPTLLAGAGILALAVVGMLASREVRGLAHHPPPLTAGRRRRPGARAAE